MFKRRVLSFFLAVAVLLVSLLGVLPVRAGAVVPVGLIESAFASYAVSSGYQFHSEQMDDNLFLGLFRELYDDFVTVMAAAGEEIRSWDAYTNKDVYIDNSGQIVISYGVAQDWAGAMDWIQSHYDIQDGGEPVTVVSGTSVYVGPNGSTAYPIVCDTAFVVGATTYYLSSVVGGNSTYNDLRIGVAGTPATVLVSLYGDWYYIASVSGTASGSVAWIGFVDNNDGSPISGALRPTFSNGFYVRGGWYFNAVDLSPYNPAGLSAIDFAGQSGGLASLAASIASTVIDVAQGVTEDDSLVIGVGAAAGATATDIAQDVANGIRAGTLEPTATITATDVIDTPVQPYPDVDGLGLPSLGAALVSRFPFCIPWDFVDTLRLVAADPRPPVFDVDLVPQSFKSRVGMTADTTFRVDLSGPQYAKVFLAIRWATLVSFCLGLALLTKRLIWTA